MDVEEILGRPTVEGFAPPSTVSLTTGAWPRLFGVDGRPRPGSAAAGAQLAPSAGPGGEVVYFAEEAGNQAHARLLSPAGDTIATADDLTPPAAHGAAVLPDGEAVMAVRHGSGAWLASLGRRGYQRLVELPGGDAFRPPWPDANHRGEVIYAGGNGHGGELSVLDPSTGIRQVVLRGTRAVPVRACWSPDARRLAVSLAGGGGHSLAILDLDNRELRPIPDSAHVGPAAWDPGGDAVVFAHDRWPSATLVRHRLDGRGREVLVLGAGLSGFGPRTSVSGQWFEACGPAAPNTVWEWPTGSPGAEAVLAPSEMPPLVMTDAVELPGTSGPLPALRLRPADGRPSGLVVSLHGGPSGSWRLTWSPLHYALVAQGLTVLLLNPRGSTGLPARYRHLSACRYGMDDVADIARCVEAVAGGAFGPVGGVGLMGHSYGGYLAYQAGQRHPDLIRAIVMTSSFAGVEDLALSADAGVSRFRRRAFPGASGEDEIAPIVPVLAVHGEHDRQMPVAAARRRAAAWPGHVRLLELDGEGHAFRHRARIVAWIEAATSFFEERLCH